jgi:propanol-preferring alcohol dehydrogenase
MKAMQLFAPQTRLCPTDIPDPRPGHGEILVKVGACAVCRTDLHIIDGDLPDPKLPLIPGHEIVGEVIGLGPGANRFLPGARVGIPWLGWTCGKCSYCRAGQENLCDEARFTGYHRDGGFAELVVADQRCAVPIPDGYSDTEAAPLLCAGLIGYRALRMAPEARRIGLYGFGAAAHIVTQMARFEGREIFAFVRPGDTDAAGFALKMGANWAGPSDRPGPEPLDAALIFAPAGSLVPRALEATAKGGCVICAGIHMSDIPSFPYDLLWGERVLRSVANLTRGDGEEFLRIASQVPVRTHVEAFGLEAANDALAKLRAGDVRGSLVIVP